ncbi:unnamed protein product [marine sediment metagenome]|uniref:Putative metallopeptidase domain-containing protein n=1 Tax=marine sediment metagenome TaxID=412755 RepID=X1PW66_9ZZZZ
MEIDYKILKVVSSMGFNYLDISNLLEMSEKVPLAAWGVNKKTGEGKIFLNPKVAKFPPKQIELVIRHEVLHYAGYFESKAESFKNRNLSNFTMDIAVNRILALAYEGEMNKLCKKIYPKGSEKSPLALAQPHLAHFHENCPEEERISSMWNEIWSSESIPSPMSLYFRLLDQKFDEKQNPWRSPEEDSGQKREGSKIKGKSSGQSESEGEKSSKSKSKELSQDKKPSDGKLDEELDDGSNAKSKGKGGTGDISFHEIPENLKEVINEGELFGQLDKQIESMKKDVSKDPNAPMTGGGFSTAASTFFHKTLAKARGGLDLRAVTRFIGQLNLRKEMPDVLEPLIQEASSTSRRQLYPYRLSRLGTVYVACGISDVIPFFWNRIPENQKLSVSVYVDTSPSMRDCIEQEIWLIDRLKDSFPSKIFAFSGDVRETSIREFTKGIYYRGPSTCFNAVIQHFLEQQKEEFALIFTDGESAVRSDLQAKFRKSRKRLFAIYFNKEDYKRNIMSNLDRIAEKTTTLQARRLTR